MTCDDCGNRVRLVHDYEPGYAPKRSHPVRLAPTPESSAEADGLPPDPERRADALAYLAAHPEPSAEADAAHTLGACICDGCREGFALSRPATPPLDGIVAELMGVEAHLDEALERLVKANLTLAALAIPTPETASPLDPEDYDIGDNGAIIPRIDSPKRGTIGTT